MDVGRRRPSYWHQAGTEPLLPLTVAEVLDDATNRWPDKVALLSTYQKHSFTFTELRHRVNALAAGLVRLGVVPGDRLAIWGHNSSQWYCAYLAATSIGIIVAKLDPAAAPKEVLTNLKKIEPRAILCEEYYDKSNCIEAVARIRSELGSPILIAISDKHYPNSIRFKDVCSDVTPELLNKVEELKKLVEPDWGCDIIFTSGTTGHPKGALLSHYSLLNSMLLTGRRGHFAKEVYECYWYSVPMCGHDTNSETEETACLKYLMVAGAPMSAALMHALNDTFESLNVLATLGMTETSGVTFMTSPDDHLDKVSTTVGRVLDHLEVKIVDSEGRMVPMGTPGELWVRGYANMLGYWGQPDKTQEIKQEDGWLKTGDQLVLTEEGYGSVMGRLKEMIIRESFNLFPMEIEQFLQSHPDILDVQAFGVPDPRVSEEMCVYIRTRDNVPLTEQDVRDFCNGQIADWKIPRYIMFVEDFPRLATGKVAKQQLKKLAIEQLGLLNKEENFLYVAGIQ